MTKQEKLVIYFLIAMLVLGFAVKFYKAKANRINLKVEKVDIDILKISKEKNMVNINTAAARDLARLPGIGPGLAQRIVDYRDKNGNFISADDLKEVSGIGERRYQEIKDYIVVE